mmetsp:Transcript_4033/g.12452  ORF Transcript_4033/g.12452 Transcript_4033/m.12452 type:complete len:205 (-) Transcript_4033:144-758(-)
MMPTGRVSSGGTGPKVHRSSRRSCENARNRGVCTTRLGPCALWTPAPPSPCSQRRRSLAGSTTLSTFPAPPRSATFCEQKSSPSMAARGPIRRCSAPGRWTIGCLWTLTCFYLPFRIGRTGLRAGSSFVPHQTPETCANCETPCACSGPSRRSRPASRLSTFGGIERSTGYKTPASKTSSPASAQTPRTTRPLDWQDRTSSRRT